MTDTQTDIERIVMRRVHLIRVLQLVISTVVFASLAFVAALWGIGREVWVARVFENGPQDFLGHASYLLYAFMHTRFIVQALAVLTLISLGFLVREIVRLSTVLITPSHS
jgi:hypothetical protein